MKIKIFKDYSESAIYNSYNVMCFIDNKPNLKYPTIEWKNVGSICYLNPEYWDASFNSIIL